MPTAIPLLVSLLAAPTLDIGAATSVPIYAGVQSQLELPHRILVRAELGIMPSAYVDVINNVVVAAGGYGENDAAIIKDAISNSFVLRLGAGFRPWEGLGLESIVGYSLISLGGGLSARDAISLATGTSFPSGTNEREIPLSSTLHGFYAGLGWRFVVGEHWIVRCALTYEQVFASNTTLDLTARRPAGQQALDKIEAELNGYMDDLYTSYVKATALTLSFNYRL